MTIQSKLHAVAFIFTFLSNVSHYKTRVDLQEQTNKKQYYITLHPAHLLLYFADGQSHPIVSTQWTLILLKEPFSKISDF